MTQTRTLPVIPHPEDLLKTWITDYVKQNKNAAFWEIHDCLLRAGAYRSEYRAAFASYIEELRKKTDYSARESLLLGLAFRYGLGVDVNANIADNYINEAVKKNEPAALTFSAMKKPDEKASVEQFILATEKKDSRAAYQLILIADEIEEEKNVKEERRRDAAIYGNYLAMEELYQNIKNKNPLESNWLKPFHQAINNGYARGYTYLFALSNPTLTEYNTPLFLAKTADDRLQESAAQYFQNALNNHDGLAHYLKAQQLEEKDSAMAAYHYRWAQLHEHSLPNTQPFPTEKLTLLYNQEIDKRNGPLAPLRTSNWAPHYHKAVGQRDAQSYHQLVQAAPGDIIYALLQMDDPKTVNPLLTQHIEKQKEEDELGTALPKQRESQLAYSFRFYGQRASILAGNAMKTATQYLQTAQEKAAPVAKKAWEKTAPVLQSAQQTAAPYVAKGIDVASTAAASGAEAAGSAISAIRQRFGKS